MSGSDTKNIEMSVKLEDATPAELIKMINNMKIKMEQITKNNEELKQSNKTSLERLDKVSVKNIGDKLKIPNPPPFTGKERKYAGSWIAGMEQQFKVRDVTEDLQKVMWAASFFQDDAMLWWENIQLYVQTWVAFKDVFYKQYRPVDSRQQCGDNLLKMKQITSVEKLNEYVRLNRYGADMNVYTEKVVKELYYNALKPTIKVHIPRSSIATYPLEQVMMQAQEVDREVSKLFPDRSESSEYHRRGYGFEKKKESSTYIKQEHKLGNVSKKTEEDDESDENADRDMKVMYMDKKEVERHMKSGLCFQCHRRGHLKRDCPDMKKDGKKDFHQPR